MWQTKVLRVFTFPDDSIKTETHKGDICVQHLACRGHKCKSPQLVQRY